MAKLSDFADYVWVSKRMSDYKVKPLVFTNKKGINQYRQKEQANAKESLWYVSTDFDLMSFPFRRDLRRKDRKGFTSERDLLRWLVGKYQPPESYIERIAEKIDRKLIPYTPFPEWLRSMGIDMNEKRNVDIRLLVTQLEPTLIPDTVQRAHELGIDVRRYNKKEDKQPRGCIIDGKGENPRVYHIFKDFRPGEVKIEEIIPGFPQQALTEGKTWWGLASDDSKYVNFYSKLYKKEINSSPVYEKVLEGRTEIEEIRKGMKQLETGIKKIQIL